LGGRFFIAAIGAILFFTSLGLAYIRETQGTWTATSVAVVIILGVIGGLLLIAAYRSE